MELIIREIKNIKEADLELGQMNVIAGASGAGKSSIKEALCFGYTGINLQSASSTPLLRGGSLKGGVSVADSDMTIARIIENGKNTVKLDGAKVADKVAEQSVIQRKGLDYQTLAVMFDSSRFLEMEGNEKLSFLTRITGVKLTPEKILKYADGLSQEAESITKAYFDGKQEISTADIEKALKEFSSSRALEKKRLAEITQKLQALGAATKGITGKEDLQNAMKKVEAEKAEKQKKLTEISKEIGAQKQIELQKQALRKTISEAESQIKNLKVTMNAKYMNVDLDTEIQLAEKELDEVRETCNKVEKIMASAEGEIKAAESLLKRLQGSACPLTSKLVCTVDKTAINDELNNTINVNKSIIESNAHLVNLGKSSITSLQQNISQMKAQMKTEMNLKLLEQKKADAEVNLAKLPAVNQNLLSQYDELVKEVSKLEEEYKSFSVSVLSIVELEKLTNELPIQENKVAAYEILCREFSPKGISNRIIQNIADKFTETCNQYLAELMPDNRIIMNFDNKFSIYIENTKMGFKRDAKFLSTGEALRVAIILQYVFSKISGCKIMFVDNLNFVDKENQVAICDLINNIKDDFDLFCVSLTSTDEEEIREMGDCLNADKVFFVNEGYVKGL